VTPPSYIPLQLANLLTEVQPSRWAEAEAEMQAALRMAIDDDDPVQRILIESQLATYLAGQGRKDDAVALLQQVWQQTIDLSARPRVDPRVVLSCQWTVLERMDAVDVAPADLVNATFERCRAVAERTSHFDWLGACVVSLASLEHLRPDQRRILLSWIDNLVQLQTDSASAWTAKGAVEYRSGKFADALASLNQGATLAKSLSVTNRLYRSMTEFQLGDPNNAAADFQLARQALMIANPLQLLSLRQLRDEAAEQLNNVAAEHEN
jgi:hypothetical protein